MDCSNAVCNATEVAVARDLYGDNLLFSCSCKCIFVCKLGPKEPLNRKWADRLNCLGGRKQVDCCSISTAPPPPITCSVNLCDTDPGYCPPSDGDDEAANNFKRDLEALDGDEGDDYQTLEKRAKGQGYPVRLRGGITMEIIAAAYPVASRLWQTQAGQQALRRFFQLPVDDCPATTVNQGDVPAGPSPSVPARTRWDTEHPIDVSDTLHIKDLETNKNL